MTYGRNFIKIGSFAIKELFFLFLTKTKSFSVSDMKKSLESSGEAAGTGEPQWEPQQRLQGALIQSRIIKKAVSWLDLI